MGRLRRCLHSWRGLGGQHDERQQALARAQALLRRALLRRSWQEWRHVAGLRWWKVQLEQRDEQIHRLGVQASAVLSRRCVEPAGLPATLHMCRGLLLVLHSAPALHSSRLPSLQVRRLESRPVWLMQRRRLRLWLGAWQQEAWRQRAKRDEWASLVQSARRSDMLKAFAGWQAVAAEKAAQGRERQRVRRVLARLRLRHAVHAWRAAVCSLAMRLAAKAAAQRLQQQLQQQRAVRGWRYMAWFHSTAAQARAVRQRRTAAAVFGAWRRRTALAVARRALLVNLAAARASQQTAFAFSAWLAAVEGRQARRRVEELARCGVWHFLANMAALLLLLQRATSGSAVIVLIRSCPPSPCAPCRVSEQAKRLAAENASLRQEAERLGRVIDSGDWGRLRMQELLQAGRVLQQERDALATLVAGVQRQGQGSGGGYDGSTTLGVSPLVDATNSLTTAPPLAAAAGGALQQRYGLQACDAGDAVGSPRLASRAVSPDARNRLLVRGGSSFNAMVSCSCWAWFRAVFDPWSDSQRALDMLARGPTPCVVDVVTTTPPPPPPPPPPQVRALKQDLVASGTLQRGGPAALYEVDKVS